MSWVDDKAKASLAKETIEEDRKKLIASSNYWQKLAGQVEQDVTEINSHDYWKKRLGTNPLQFKPVDGANGYQVIKSGSPGVTVSFIDQGEQTLVKRDYLEQNPVAKDPAYSTNEPMEVVTSGNNVALKSSYLTQNTFIVPEQASEYILRAIIESLTISEAVE